jgi:uncharacterized protein YndB with AHSA1/START domain
MSMSSMTTMSTMSASMSTMSTMTNPGNPTSSSIESNAAESPRTLVVERVFPHPPEKLWRALTEGPLLAQWMMKNDFEPVVGRRFQFRADPAPNWSGVVDCEVRLVEPMERLSYHWGVGGSESGLQWVVLWTLTPVEGGTHVRMEQSGFGPDQKAAYQGAKYGWQKFFGGLEQVLGGLE